MARRDRTDETDEKEIPLAFKIIVGIGLTALVVIALLFAPDAVIPW